MFEYLHSGIYQTDFVKVQILERFFKHYSFTTYGGGGGGTLSGEMQFLTCNQSLGTYQTMMLAHASWSAQ